MAEILKITKGQPFSLCIPLVILNADGTKEEVDAASVSNVQVSLQSACGAFDVEHGTYEHYIVLNLPATLKTGVHAVSLVGALLTGRVFSIRIKRAFEVVDWDCQSNWSDYIVGSRVVPSDKPFIVGAIVPDAEYETLKAYFASKVAEIDNLSQAVIALRYDLDHLDPYVLLSDEELDEIVADIEPTPAEPEERPEEPEPEVDNRPRIDAYNSRLDVTVTLRRTSVEGDQAHWEGNEQQWLTDYPYSLGGNVYNVATYPLVWGKISLISE